MSRLFALFLALGALCIAVPSADAAAPEVDQLWVTDVTATGANLRAAIDTGGLSTSFHFEYVDEQSFQDSGFDTASQTPGGSIGGASALVVRHIGGLTPATAYRYRLLATNDDGPATSLIRILTTQETGSQFSLPDRRAWELVTPRAKDRGLVAPPGSLFGGGHLQAAAAAPALTYSSATASGSESAPPVSQYLSRRTASGWLTESLAPPLPSAIYGDEPDGSPFRAFSSDLSRSLLFGGLPCRGASLPCIPNPSLPGSGAPPGYMAYYLRGADGALASLLSAAELSHTAVAPARFQVTLAGATPDLSTVVISTCARLAATATEVLDGLGGCVEDEQNLYASTPAGLRLINVLPGASEGTPGAQLAAPIGAISADGAFVYWSDGAGLYLSVDGGETIALDAAGDAQFQTASADGKVAFYIVDEHLYRFLAATGASTDLTPSGGVKGVLGAAADGSVVYYLDAGGLRRWSPAGSDLIAEAAAAENYPPATGSARLSADGGHLAFLSDVGLGGYDNAGHTEAYLYGPAPGASQPSLICASCNPTGERPQGDAALPGVLVNGSTALYRPRSLSADGARLYFTSEDRLSLHDTNSRLDVYQWQRPGSGSCSRLPGCVNLISSGRGPDGARFIDASADGTDVYFLTDESLLLADPGSADLYDARIGGGFPEPEPPIPCIADACQPLPAPTRRPDPGHPDPNAGNPATAALLQGKAAQAPPPPPGRATARRSRAARAAATVIRSAGGRR